MRERETETDFFNECIIFGVYVYTLYKYILYNTCNDVYIQISQC